MCLPRLPKAQRRCPLACAVIGLVLQYVTVAPAHALHDALAASAWPQRLPVPDTPSWQTSVRLGAYEAADAVPVRRIEGDWAVYRPRRGDGAVVQVAHAELMAVRRGWEVALTARTEGLLIGSRGAFDLVHAYKQKIVPPSGTSLEVDVRANGLWLTGVRVARSGGSANPGMWDPHDAPSGWRWTLAATGLAVRRAVRADAFGQAAFDAAAGDRYSATASRSDSSKSFGGFGNAGARGAGVTLDAGLAWRSPGGMRFNVSAVDLWSRIGVDGAALQTARLSSQTISYDAQGYLAYQPALTGRNQAADVRTRLTRKWALSAELPVHLPLLGPSRVGAQWARMGPLERPTLWWSRPLAGRWVGTIEADPRFDAVGIGLSSASLGLMLRAGVGPDRQLRVMGGQVAWLWRR